MESNSRTLLNSVFKTFTRSVHHKPLRPKKYPQVNIKDVQLKTERQGFRKVRPPIIAQSPTKTLFSNFELAKKYIEAGKRVPNRFMAQMDSKRAAEQFEEFQDRLAFGEPHFTVGKKQIYFPQGRICLLQPTAKHTPYQARFLVPKSMNKMDLRDYLWNIYGLRALNVTVQLAPGKFTRGPWDNGRYRMSQHKKMTIDMMEPFIWPEISAEKLDSVSQQKRTNEEIVLSNTAKGSDKSKPLDVYGGIYKQNIVPKPFIPEQMKRSGSKVVKSLERINSVKEERELLERFLKL